MFKRINKSFEKKVNKPLLIASFIIYLIIVIWIIFFRCGIPFFSKPSKWILKKSILEAFKDTIFLLPFDASIPLTLLDIICNLLILIPFGMYLNVLFNKVDLLRDFLIGLSMILCFETIQLFTRLGQFSIFDLLWNISGLLVGELIYMKLKSKFTFKVINYIQLFVVVLFLPVVIYAIISVPLNWNIYSPIFDFEKYPYILY